jgi:hypothetical protein
MPCRVHSTVENTKNLDADAAPAKDDNVALVWITEDADIEFRSFAPQSLVTKQPFQTRRDRNSIVACLLFAPLFPSVLADLGQIAKRWPRQSKLHYPPVAG